MSDTRTREEIGSLALAGILIAATLLRLVGLREWPFEQDELYTLRDAIDLGASSSGPGISARPLYYLLQHVLLALLPPTPGWLRLPPLVFGLLGVWVTARLGARVFGRTAGIVAALLVAVSPWHIYASQFARYWSLVYLLFAFALLALLRALDGDRRRDWFVVAGAVGIGAVTHPTFVFPLVGALLALHLVSADGRVRWDWPSRNAFTAGWIPAVLVAAAVLVPVRLFAPAGRFSNGVGRGIGETLRVFLGMIQWSGMDVAVVACLAGAAFLLAPRDRRWGAVTLVGCATGVLLLLVSGVGNDIYADYGMAMLPLVFVTAGGVVHRLGEVAGAARLASTIGATVLLVSSALPGTLSHYSNGTRYDHRPSFARIADSAEPHPVFAWPIIVARHYAPELVLSEFAGSAAQLERASVDGGFWVLTSVSRQGLVPDDGSARQWLDRHCRVELRTERPRFDYRSYRVELLWCGDMPAPATRS